MPLVKYVEADGSSCEAMVSVGTSLMQGAVDNAIEGILAECGGSCACATCHCYINDEWRHLTGEPDDAEREMLGFVDELRDSSRLSCQIEVSEQMNGLIVHLPASQG